MQEITVSGLVTTTPRFLSTAEGLNITSFRLASSGVENSDGTTNWYTITSFDTLAKNVRDSLEKGNRVVVSGLLRIRDWDNGEITGTSVEIEASSIGHDLNYCTTKPVRVQEKPRHACNCSKCDKNN
jgi:single-strand DNA-binding protein